MGGNKPKGTSNRFWSTVEKTIKRLVVPVEERLLCVVCKVPCPADVVVERASDSINSNGYVPEDSSVHPDDLVVKRVHYSIKSWGYGFVAAMVPAKPLLNYSTVGRQAVEFHTIPAATVKNTEGAYNLYTICINPISALCTKRSCIVLRDFDNLKMMYDVDWSKMHRDIFQHKKKDAYALLYSGELSRAAEHAIKNHFERKISTIVDNYQSFYGNTQVEILTIKATKTNGGHLSCDFIDVTHAEVILNTYKKSHGAGGDTVRVEPHSDEVQKGECVL